MDHFSESSIKKEKEKAYFTTVFNELFSFFKREWTGASEDG
jgi:hypothetical protein